MSKQSRNRLVGMKVVSVFSPYRNIYRALLLCIEHYKAEKSVDRPLYQLKALNSWFILANSPHQMIRNND